MADNRLIVEHRRLMIPSVAALVVCGGFVLLSLGAGCRCSRKEDAQKTPAGKASALATVTSHQERALLEQAYRAELRQDGLVINLGTPDQHKYVRGGWKTGWGKSGRDGVATYIELPRQGVITYHDWEAGAYTPVFLARAATPGQRLAAVLDGEKLGARDVPTTWTALKYAPVTRAKPGRRTLVLLPSAGARLQLQWIWLRTRDAAAAPMTRRVGPRTFKKTRHQALLAPRPAAYSFYLSIPKRAELLLDYASRQPGRLTITAAQDGKAPVQLLAADSGAQWRPARLDLAPLAGQVIRLDLALSAADGARELGGALARPRVTWPVSAIEKPAITAANRAQNLIHVVVDAARQDAYRAFNPKARARTPALSALADQGVRFTNAQVNASHTVASISSMITSRYPYTFLGSERHRSLGHDLPVLAMHMFGSGVATSLVSANPYLTQTFGFHRKQDRFFYYPMEEANKHTRRMFTDSLAWIKEQKLAGKRFYLHIQTMDPHHPYRFHKDLTPRLLGKGFAGKTYPVSARPDKDEAERRYTRALYAGEIEHADRELGRFVAGLKKLGVLKRTLVIFSNDHGEELFERGRNGHGHSLHEEQLRTPLVMRYPALLPRGLSVDHPVEMVDLVPTVIELMGLGHMPGIHGKSMVPTIFGRPPVEPDYVLAELSGVALRMGPMKMIHSPPFRRVFDLRTDPGERVDLSSRRPVAGRALDVRLGEAMAAPVKGTRLGSMGGWTRPPAAVAPVISPQLRMQLKALGYIQ